ncbi:ATP phosphoribosyltransferase regulatory subunit [Myxacorys almedinensis]|uniref:ATP phosphoribosyltransferase regulatory subunit n=1 Tax=Myxacorys almedinensis A TaxID=2690445 RepID=A0A8J7Z847_9CYAN|nr:ATP phosphoribosyltransferase regulatory subunit [Myxacorys almedinensis]NDJ19676.1 ATP phosphoribosyltransferase regulatory subunit [Myxacorys almedinensis A]
MVYQPPAGARDLLPLDVAQKHWLEERLQQVFHRWGYHRIITSTLERLDTLMAGGAITRSTVIQLQHLDDEPLGLRPELTASIARAAVTRMASRTYPQRLYYNANVFRRSQEGDYTRQQEFYQAGVELLGIGGLLADAEVLMLLMDCLHHLHLPGHLVLGEAGLTRSLLSIFPDPLCAKVRHAISTLDRIALETMELSDDLRDRALTLLDLRGKPSDVLQNVSQLPLNSTQQDSVRNLKSLIELLQDSQTDVPIVLDLSLIRTFDYYTGIVFEVVTSSASSGQTLIGQGGRYDQLLGLYHPQGESLPGIGFSLQLEELHQILLSLGQLPTQDPTSDWLVVSETSQTHAIAFTHAQKLRDSSALVRVEMDLSGNDHDQIREYARSRRIPHIAWIESDGSAAIERVN